MPTTATTNGDASSAFQAALAAAGYQNDSLSDVARIQLAFANLINNPAFKGAMTGTSVAFTGAVTGASVGYATGAGGAVTQGTNRSTGVTLAKISGVIQTDTTSLAAGASAEFPVTCTSLVAVTDVPVVAIRSGTTTNATKVNVSAVAANVFNITVTNGHASTAETGAILINYAIIKAVAS